MSALRIMMDTRKCSVGPTKQMAAVASTVLTNALEAVGIRHDFRVPQPALCACAAATGVDRTIWASVHCLDPLQGLDDREPLIGGFRHAVAHCPKSTDVAGVVRGMSRVDQLAKPADVGTGTGQGGIDRAVMAALAHSWLATDETRMKHGSSRVACDGWFVVGGEVFALHPPPFFHPWLIE